jgi:hypothetical protein
LIQSLDRPPRYGLSLRSTPSLPIQTHTPCGIAPGRSRLSRSGQQDAVWPPREKPLKLGFAHRKGQSEHCRRRSPRHRRRSTRLRRSRGRVWRVHRFRLVTPRQLESGGHDLNHLGGAAFEKSLHGRATRNRAVAREKRPARGVVPTVQAPGQQRQRLRCGRAGSSDRLAGLRGDGQES